MKPGLGLAHTLYLSQTQTAQEGTVRYITLSVSGQYFILLQDFRTDFIVPH